MKFSKFEYSMELLAAMDYLESKISRIAFWELAKFKYPTHQIVFCTKKSLDSISFIGSEFYEE